MPTKTLVVLANSIKKGGRCIAGREITPDGALGDWVRPVCPDGEGSEGALMPARHCRLEDGGMPQVLDVARVPLTRGRNDPGQPENGEVEPTAPWSLVPSQALPPRAQLAESPESLWLEAGGRQDRISPSALAAEGRAASLVLIRPTDFRVLTDTDHATGHPRRRTRGLFAYGGHAYDFSVMGDGLPRGYAPLHDGRRRVFTPSFGDECLLCISLSPEFMGYHYKLIATVIPIS